MATLALIPNLATSWRYLHQLQIRPQGGIGGLGSKFGYCVIAMEYNIGQLPLSASIELGCSSARLSSFKSQQGLRGTYGVWIPDP